MTSERPAPPATAAADRLPRRAYLADTSALVGLEQGRLDRFPDDAPIAVSVITLAELQLGVLSAADLETRAIRLRTLAAARELNCLGIDEEIAERWAVLVASARANGHRAKINDCWIAAIAVAHEACVLTQDDDFDELDVDVAKL